MKLVGLYYAYLCCKTKRAAKRMAELDMAARRGALD